MSITDIKGTVTLNNGIEMPYLGLGVFEINEGAETIETVKFALECGYRHIDTASIYLNENSVGEAIRSSNLARNEVFVTTKVWNTYQGYQETLDAFNKSLDRLKFDYIDLYLIHWPVHGKYIDTWRAMEELYSKKLIKAIGVSNFLEHHLENLIKNTTISPMVNQVEFHPYLIQPELLKLCEKKKIQFEAWSPLMKGKVVDIPLIIKIGQKYKKDPVQVVLRWNLQKNIVTIPKSAQKDRIKSNADIFDFELTQEDMLKIDSLNKNHRIGADPDNIDF
jgi:diketogulonate reductase-like aldo/keto reductase